MSKDTTMTTAQTIAELHRRVDRLCDATKNAITGAVNAHNAAHGLDCEASELVLQIERDSHSPVDLVWNAALLYALQNPEPKRPTYSSDGKWVMKLTGSGVTPYGGWVECGSDFQARQIADALNAAEGNRTGKEV